MGVKIRKVEWRWASFRPVDMPSVVCPRVFDWTTRKESSAWLGVMHCNACAFAVFMKLDYRSKNGEVHCAAE